MSSALKHCTPNSRIQMARSAHEGIIGKPNSERRQRTAVKRERQNTIGNAEVGNAIHEQCVDSQDGRGSPQVRCCTTVSPTTHDEHTSSFTHPHMEHKRVAQAVERHPLLRSSRRTWPMDPSYHQCGVSKPSQASLKNLNLVHVMSCFACPGGSCSLPQNFATEYFSMSCGPSSCRVTPCHDPPHHWMPCRSLAEDSCHVVSCEILPVAL